MIRAAWLAALALTASGTDAAAGGDGCLGDLAFADAVIHAGATDYVFDLASGIAVSVRIENGSGEGGTFAGLVAPQDDGPALPAPEQLGRRFDLCRNGDGLVLTPRP